MLLTRIQLWVLDAVLINRSDISIEKLLFGPYHFVSDQKREVRTDIVGTQIPRDVQNLNPSPENWRISDLVLRSSKI